MSDRAFRLWVGAAMLVGLVLRVLAARGDLWLDEILTLFVATSTPSWGALLNIHHDNVHLLTALWLRLVGADAPAMLCRLPSIVASTATIGLAAWHLRRLGEGVAIAAAFILAASPMQVQYGSEARGYATAGVMMILGLELVARLSQHPSWALRSVLVLVALAGVAAHLTFMLVLPGLLVAAFVEALAHGSARAAIRRAAMDVGPACMAAMLLAGWSLHGMVFAGGLDRGALAVVGGAFSLGSAPLSVVLLLLALLAIAIASWPIPGQRWPGPSPRRPAARILSLAAIAVPPPLLLMLHAPAFLHERYLFLSATAMTTLVASVVGLPLCLSLDRRGSLAMRAIPAAFAALVTIVAASSSLNLIAIGRGDFRAAVVRARQDSRGGALTVAGNNDFRTKTMLAHAIPRLPQGPEVRYLEADEARTHPPDFWLEHVPTWDESIAPSNVRLADSDYRLVAQYPAYGLSGFTWRLYRRLSPPSGS